MVQSVWQFATAALENHLSLLPIASLVSRSLLGELVCSVYQVSAHFTSQLPGWTALSL